ncbi:MAG: hypothetical protein P1V20_23020 [Verrucomicrobiales bacterium]|nr:hypothetical protein [Verrucomicrobiales bacterium]
MQTDFPDFRSTIGFDPATRTSLAYGSDLIEFINMQLAALGEPIIGDRDDYPFLQMSQKLMAHYQAKDRFRDELRPPCDCRIQNWLGEYLNDVDETVPCLPGTTVSLGQHGVARALSLPVTKDVFCSDIVDSYRVANGVLHNPKNDRRTTKGVFHVTEGGLPIPDDKKAVPKRTFARMLDYALSPPKDLLLLPVTSDQEEKAHAWVSLLLRPVVCPSVPPFIEEQRMEVHFFAPGNLVSNLDFVESIFGNAGDPYLSENDAGLDVEHWSGHTGCVILAPHLLKITKVQAGLPHYNDASERQIRDGMCWKDEDELYNDGTPFKLTARDHRGVIVTLISDNYFGYCKKEVKTQISYAANLMGLAEEEHAGGALAFKSFDLGEDFRFDPEFESGADHTFSEVIERLGDSIDLQPEGYGIDRSHPDIVYVPETAYFAMNDLSISWPTDEGESRIKLLADKVYILPSGYKVRLLKPGRGRRWRLIGSTAQSCMCHKPCTVSGGGKSEISKMISDAIIHAPFYVNNLQEDMDYVEKILSKNYGDRYKDPSKNKDNPRPILSPDRSLGSVIKLLTASPEYTDEHNDFIKSIPTEIRDLVMLVKRFYSPEWGTQWRDRFSVDRINGQPGHELRYKTRPVIKSYLRVGFDEDGSWRVFGLRSDYSPAQKVQMEDDITASVVVPESALTTPVNPGSTPSLKFTHNCEFRLFQRPDDAVIRGYDHQTEKDMAGRATFFSNYEPLDRKTARDMVDDAVRFDQFTEPMQNLVKSFAETGSESDENYFVSSADPRIVDGVPSKNPRYLQTRLDMVNPQGTYVAETGLRLNRRLSAGDPLHNPVDIVCPGRRNNPPDGKIRPLCVFNPIHFLPLPEAFMEFISSMTGKSPSTTGAGSEGALTKAPFNALLPIHDLNAALVSFIVSGYDPFVTAAGYVGPKYRVDHDISLLVPEVWCRMERFERDPEWLINNGMLEPVPDVEFEGRMVPGTILGYRITQAFVNRFMARIFSNPSDLFPDEMLQPENQDIGIFADGVDNILATHQRVAGNYFNDGGIDAACPPLRALLYIMLDGSFEGKKLSNPEIRNLFCREAMLDSDWYKERIDSQVASDRVRVEKMKNYFESFDGTPGLEEKWAALNGKLEKYYSDSYRESLIGTIGRDPALEPG